MADIRAFLHPGLAAGGSFGLEAKVMVWINAGTGQVLALEPGLLALEGVLQLFGKEKPLAVQVSLGEPVGAADGTVTGPCTLRLGQEADGEAVYRVEGDRLVLLGTIEGDATRITLKADARHSLIDIEGKRRVSLRLTPG